MYSDQYNQVSRQGPLTITDTIADPQNTNFGVVKLAIFVTIPAGGGATATLMNLPANAQITAVSIINATATALTSGTTITAQRVNQDGSTISPAVSPLLTTASLTTTAGVGTIFNTATFTNQDTNLANQSALSIVLGSHVIPNGASLQIVVDYFMTSV